MKKRYLLPLIIAASFSACKKEDKGMVVTTTTPPTTDTLQGSITTSKTLDPSTAYILKGQVYVKNNATLTIPAGVTVSAIKYDAEDAKSVLVITQGSKLIVDGTVDKPVVFTSAADAKAPGDWGAIIIEGKAATNTGTGNTVGLAVSDDTKYGGNVSDDNSGSLKYLRIEYCGGINPKAEEEWAVDKASGLCLESVGSGTMVDNVMVSHSLDDAFQFVGGTVNATHLISYNSGDDDFDFDLGYTGQLQYIIGYRSSLTSYHALRANGFESYNDAVPTINMPLTHPVVSNMTIIGPQGTEKNANLNQGVYSRKGTRLAIRNSIVAEYPEGGLMVCNKTRPVLLYGPTAGADDPGSEFKYNLVHSDTLSRTFSWDRDALGIFGDPVLRDFAINSDNQNTLIQQSSDLMLKAMYSDGNPDLTPLDGSPAAKGANFDGTLFSSSFFTKVDYRGAVGPSNWAAASNWAVWK